LTWNLPPTPAGWVDPGIANALAANAPLAAITVDGFAGAQPTPSYPAVTYPQWTGLTTQYGKNMYSSMVQVERCAFIGFPVAAVWGVNTNNQGDYAKVTDCIISQGAFGISINNTQSRNVDVKNISYAFLHTLLDNMTFGAKSGTWAGPISNLCGGECVQIFNFNSNAGGLDISNVHAEGGLRRLGNWNSYLGLKLREWQVVFADSQYEASRGLVECASFSGEVTFENCQFTSHYGIQNLVYGGNARVTLGYGNYIACGAAFPNNSTVGYQAAAYGGGFILNGGALYPASQNKVRGASQALAATPSLATAAAALWSDSECLPPSGSTNYIFLYREGLESFRDLMARKWIVKQTTPVYTPVSSPSYQKSGGAISGISQTGPTLTFTYSYTYAESSFGYNNWGFSVGDIIVDQNTGALLVVTAKTGTSPTFTITAVQQNCYTGNYPGGTWTTTTTLANGTPTTVPTSGGAFRFIRTQTQFSQYVFFGDFTSGSPSVANIHTGDLNGSTAATYLLSGTLLFAPGLRSGATPQAPIATEFPVTKNTYIGVVTNGTTTTGATMTLVAGDGVTAVNAVNTGRYPITPLGISQGV
jgi:hypothetical protein